MLINTPPECQKVGTPIAGVGKGASRTSPHLLGTLKEHFYEHTFSCSERAPPLVYHIGGKNNSEWESLGSEK